MGGSPSAPAPVAPTYIDPVNGMSFTDDPWTGNQGAAQLNAEIASRKAEEKVASDAATKAATDQNTANNATFQKQLSDASTNAQSSANSYFTSHGYDPSRFAASLAAKIKASTDSVSNPFANYIAPSPSSTTDAKGNVTTSTPSSNGGTSGLGANPSAAFSPNLGANIIADETSGVQTKAGHAISALFSPTYAQDNVSNSWLAPASTAALSRQFDPLTAQLSNSFKRGTLNQQGYDAANAKLSSDQTAAGSTVNGLGNRILAADRTGVDNYITGAKGDAARVDPITYDSFDPSKYDTGASNLVNGYKGSFAGDLTNAIGATSFSDLGSLLNAGGAVQGATDPTATNPTVGGPGGGGISDNYIAQQALAKQPRGLGSSGAF
jgi:hypothetical protein